MINVMSGGKVYICPTAQLSPLVTRFDYEALVWIPIGSIGNVGRIGVNTNVSEYTGWGQSKATKIKGVDEGGDPTIEVMRDTLDVGQNALRIAALSSDNFAIKIEHNDKLTPDGSGSVFYNRGLVIGPSRPQGGNEDFDVEVFMLAFQDIETIYNARGYFALTAKIGGVQQPVTAKIGGVQQPVTARYGL